jgi:hypothetical protein
MPSQALMRFIRFLTVYIIVVGGAVLLAPESMGKLSRWFADNPSYLRLIGLLERVMNLGENRIGMRIPRSAWFLRDLRFPHS